MRLTRYIISSLQFHTIFFHLEVATETGRDAQHFLRKFSLTGTDKKVGSTTNLAPHSARTYHASTLREHCLTTRFECHRSALIRNKFRHLP